MSSNTVIPEAGFDERAAKFAALSSPHVPLKVRHASASKSGTLQLALVLIK
ncbi:MAG: hypothetical protein ACJAQW_001887 [Paracoccaceae bacterium]|jgi:hypothetical protein